MQFEDFVEVFNRVFIINDISWDHRWVERRFVSTWVAGDYVAGSGGPPSEFLFQSDGDIFGSPRGSSAAKSLSSAGKRGLDSGGIGTTVGSKDENSLGDDDDDDDESEEEEEEENGDPFTDNPMYPFSVTEPTSINIALFQADKRWSASRVADDPLDICLHEYAVRGGRSRACMEYPVAIGFVVLKLSGLKMRCTTFKMKKIAGTSFGINHSNVTTNYIHLLPGRYAIVPFTHEIMQYSTEYILYTQFSKGAVEFEINDILKERPIDTVLSEDEDAEEAGRDDKIIKKSSEHAFAIPEECPDEPWMWKEDFEEQGILSIYEQVGDLAKQLRRLRAEMKRMDADVTEMKIRAEKEREKAAEKEAEEKMQRALF